MITKIKIKNLVRISLLLFLAIIIVGSSSLFSKSNAETIQKLFLNKNTNQNNYNQDLRFEKISLLPNCSSITCFKRPNDIVISNDGSFVLVVDSLTSGNQGINLRKFDFSFSLNSFVDSGVIPLIQESTTNPLLNIGLSQNNQKVFVYREPTRTENVLVQIVALQTKSVKELKSVATNGQQIGLPTFLDPNGKVIIAPILDSEPAQVALIDTETDQIIDYLTSPDIIQNLTVTPDFKKVIFTFSGDKSQSLLLYDLETNKELVLDIDPVTASLVEDLLGKIIFPNSGNKAVVSSVGGNHVLHLLNILSNKLTSKVLDKSLQGPTISTISPDGRTVIAAGNIFDNVSGFKLYKLNLSNEGSILAQSSILISDSSIVLDVDISPDQSKIYVLTLKSGAKKLKIFNMKDLSTVDEIIVSSDNTQSFLTIDPNGLYALTPNTNVEASVSIISDLNLGPIVKSIVPNIFSLNGNSPFTINGFVNLLNFSNDIKVCFRNDQICASSVVISKNGQKINGFTPRFPEAGIEDVIITAKSKLDSLSKSSKYEGLVQFIKDSVTISDTSLPEITISAPKDLAILNTKRILVIGKVDGTGSEVDSVFVNGKNATLSTEGQSSPSTVNFLSDLQFEKDGAFDITVNAKDKASNEATKTIKITIDTVSPTVDANIEVLATGEFKVSGSANGTGSNISQITVNSKPVQFTQGEQVTFSVVTNTSPVTITVKDSAGNKNESKISNPLSEDNILPIINISSPANGQIFKDTTNISVSFTVTDNASVKEVLFSGNPLLVNSNNQYSQNITLKPGENNILISATDTSDNKSTTSIKVSYVPATLPEIMIKESPSKDLLGEKEVITLPSTIEDLNSELINQFNLLSPSTGTTIDISSTVSVEIANPPPIPEGLEAAIDIPKVEGASSPPEEIPQVPKGFSFATNVNFTEDDTDVGNTQISEEEKNTQNIVVLTDSTGRVFIVGLAFFTEAEASLSNLSNHRFQTTSGKPLGLTSTITIPADATEGDSRVSILSKNDSLATIKLKIAPPINVKVGKRIIGKPHVQEPIIAKVQKSGTKLILKIKGKNFVGRTAIIDGKLEKLISKAKFFTNLTFVPDTGIKIKNFKLINNNNVVITAELNQDLTPGIKLFNVITPKGADIGAIVIPDPITDGKLQTTSNPESLILQP
ncbi:MAG: Ig-like domain-containing protein [Candidatus Melainabacteria bacterium]|nr:Ig-like domain-containing protein [Candidatus Melainabacteria bacterium]